MERYSLQVPKDSFFRTPWGQAVLGDSLEVMQEVEDETVDLVLTSPPFDLTLGKEYGNLKGDTYLDWLQAVGEHVFRILKPSGSFVLDLGGSWNKGVPTRNLYQFRSLLRLVDEVGFFLAQDFYWWNPARLPTPAEWVTIRRIRVKDAVNTIWWLSKTPYPKASNRRVLLNYSKAMIGLLQGGYTAKRRPSGHDISSVFGRDNGGAIPPNLLAVANTDSGSSYLRYCKANNLAPHPARFPAQVPEFFMRLLTNRGDFVIDPFAGSCATGEAAESLQRHWLCIEMEKTYLQGAQGRFVSDGAGTSSATTQLRPDYKVARLGRYSPTADNSMDSDLREDGGRERERSATDTPESQ